MGEEGSETPWWGTSANIVWTLGPVTVAFFIVLAVGFGWFPSPVLQSMIDNSNMLNKNNRIISDMRDDLLLHGRATREEQQILLRTLRQICRNTARTFQQNERCDAI